MKNFKNAVALLWKTSKLYFIFTFILSISSSIPEIINLVIWKKILDLVFVFLTKDTVDFKQIILYVFLHFILKISADILSRLNEFIKNIYSRKVEKYVTNETLDAIGKMQLKDMEDAEIHNTIVKATDESSGKIMGLLSESVELIQNLTTFIGMSGILISFNYKIYILIFLSIIPMAIYSQKYFNKLFNVYNKRVEKFRYIKELKNMISRSEVFKELKIFNSLPYIKMKINQITDEIINEDRKIQKELSMQGIFSRMIEVFFTYILKVVIIILGIIMKSSIGTINMNMDSATRLQGSTSNIVFIFISMYESCLYLTSFTELLEYKSKTMKSEKNGKDKSIKDFHIETIELVNIYFKYTDTSEYVIKNVSFKFMKGKTYAIVGYNGGGKSTLVKIILRLYKPQAGKVLVNGIDIDNYELGSYWEQISVVFQDFVKYPFTVSENIAMGNIKEINNIEKIANSAEAACSTTFINDLPNRYEEKLVRGWENSVDLSVGQWQRIAIARSIMRDGEMVIFDEPAAALDAKTENKILNDVMGSRKERIGIIITHRFLNIKKADEIIVLKDGVIETSGSHANLLDVSETYSELYNAQKEMI